MIYQIVDSNGKIYEKWFILHQATFDHGFCVSTFGNVSAIVMNVS